MSQDKTKWFLLFCKPKEEERSLINLTNQGIESFYPTRKVEKVRKGKRSVLSEPLFPNYLFVKLNPETDNFNAIRSTRGVANFVRFGANYATVPTALVHQIKETVAGVTDIAVDDNIAQPGDAVVLNNGVYQGLEAVFKNKVGLERSILLIKMLEQQATLEVCNTEFSLKK
ncbi:transcription/translation regulatory transformer protein RfaH [Psychrobium sp. 1_MG-2023]|uniref:transcription/translation regulatory transformer protein RfaH n=1 Tax=Psychrobium sp. 1_MG-2023 TaxID=3062624 RepID=UPI000C34BB5E|nr:transcription/translation regulatory transformer protein RfaH [Psychrobium sp. 1_MG-2023]MDP2562078.1 transcription/translation regulatory transformer protein RfaH [Psychrobium sp. 1_MG-2023]PKF55679.1 transcription/translation regulatory transformer protein RfaH [Alteromonadales bacterium alter-6D02]